MALGRGSAIDLDSSGSMRLGLEIAMIPHISDEIATPTTCRPGKGPENANPVPALGRIRLVSTIGAGFSVELAAVPPVTLNDMKPLLFDAGVGYNRRLGSSLVFAGRVHRSFGYIDGPVTCTDDDVRDATSECFNGTRSRDRYTPNILGAEVAVGSAPSERKVAWYAGAGYSKLTPRFQVHFLNSAGFLDTTRVVVDLNRVALFAGASVKLTKQVRGSAEVYATPDDGATVRLYFDTLIHRGR
jgi:hypothetical protein